MHRTERNFLLTSAVICTEKREIRVNVRFYFVTIFSTIFGLEAFIFFLRALIELRLFRL